MSDAHTGANGAELKRITAQLLDRRRADQRFRETPALTAAEQRAAVRRHVTTKGITLCPTRFVAPTQAALDGEVIESDPASTIPHPEERLEVSPTFETAATRPPEAEDGGVAPRRRPRRRRSSPRVERDLCDEIIGLVASRLDDVEDIAALLVAEAVRCAHAAGILVAALPDAESRAAVVGELKRFLPEIVEQRAGELHRGGLD